MLFYYHNEITFNCQYYRTENITNHLNPHCHTRVTSLRTARDFSCPHCHSRMYSYGAFSVLIKDFPDLPKQKKYIEFSGHRFRCTSCGETITEDIPCQCPFTRVTWDMALWITICLSVIHPFLPFRPCSLYIGVPYRKYKSISWIRRWLPLKPA